MAIYLRIFEENLWSSLLAQGLVQVEGLVDNLRYHLDSENPKTVVLVLQVFTRIAVAEDDLGLLLDPDIVSMVEYLSASNNKPVVEAVLDFLEVVAAKSPRWAALLAESRVFEACCHAVDNNTDPNITIWFLIFAQSFVEALGGKFVDKVGNLVEFFRWVAALARSEVVALRKEVIWTLQVLVELAESIDQRDRLVASIEQAIGTNWLEDLLMDRDNEVRTMADGLSEVMFTDAA